MAIIPKGKEPASIKKRLDILFPKLNQAYPDKKISGLYKDHKKWGETVTELYRALGYPDGTSFLEAYGLTVIRIPNNEINENFYEVCEYIDFVVKQSLSK